MTIISCFASAYGFTENTGGLFGGGAGFGDGKFFKKNLENLFDIIRVTRIFSTVVITNVIDGFLYAGRSSNNTNPK